MYEDDEMDRARVEGYRACQDGKTTDTNPYDWDSSEGQEWLRGWEEAEEDGEDDE